MLASLKATGIIREDLIIGGLMFASALGVDIYCHYSCGLGWMGMGIIGLIGICLSLLGILSSYTSRKLQERQNKASDEHIKSLIRQVLAEGTTGRIRIG